jgi:hypothetical protein
MVLSWLAAILCMIATIIIGAIGVTAFCLGWIFNWLARGCERAVDWMWTPRRL